jgi:hypothetical protein
MENCQSQSLKITGIFVADFFDNFLQKDHASHLTGRKTAKIFAS